MNYGKYDSTVISFREGRCIFDEQNKALREEMETLLKGKFVSIKDQPQLALLRQCLDIGVRNELQRKFSEQVYTVTLMKFKFLDSAALNKLVDTGKPIERKLSAKETAAQRWGLTQAKVS
jgi:hypothetical protein